MDSALEQGLHREYLRTSESVTHLRGQLDVKRQLQRQGPTPTKFECTFDELTVDTTVNRAVLYATNLLKRF
ncbi:MAG: restriction endonuclease, partial [Halobacteriales archaeon]